MNLWEFFGAPCHITVRQKKKQKLPKPFPKAAWSSLLLISAQKKNTMNTFNSKPPWEMRGAKESYTGTNGSGFDPTNSSTLPIFWCTPNTLIFSKLKTKSAMNDGHTYFSWILFCLFSRKPRLEYKFLNSMTTDRFTLSNMLQLIKNYWWFKKSSNLEDFQFQFHTKEEKR